MAKRNFINALVLDTKNLNSQTTVTLLLAQIQIEISLIHAIATTNADIKIDVSIARLTNDGTIKGAMIREIE